MAIIDGYKIRDQYGLHFLTFTIVGWVDIFTRQQCKDIVIDSMQYCVDNKGLHVHAYVIMPSHIHVIWSCKEGFDGLSGIVKDFKKFTSNQILHWVTTNKKESRADWLQVVFKYHAKYNTNNKFFQVWIQNNQPQELLHPKFTRQKLLYIHNNPIEAGIFTEQHHYQYSSAALYMDLGTSIRLSISIIDFGVEGGYVYA